MKHRTPKRILAALVSGVLALSALTFYPASAQESDSTQPGITAHVLDLQQFLLGESVADAADHNGDGTIDGFDLALLRQELGGIQPELDDGYVGFIQADGRLLVDEAGSQYIIKGMAFGNDVWSNPTTPPTTHHTAESYSELAEMGFNSVRFYLNYALFESDSAPYTYREEGFDWIDQNLAWAKAAGIRLVLNMHYPQGGYQSQGDGTALWTDPENQARLTALWKEIARRYADEPAILGYGLVNEPVVAASNGAESLQLWQSVAQTLTDAIRTVDQNHLIFVERMCAAQDLAGTNEQWQNFNDENNYVHIDGENIVYEFHYYEPHAFSHQGLDWAGTAGNYVTYPDETYVITAGNTTWKDSTFSGDTADLETTEWQYLESSRMTPTDDTQVICLVAQAQAIGSGGIVYVDDLKLDEYDADGNYVRTIYADSFDTSHVLPFWSNDGSGRVWYSMRGGREESGAFGFSGTTDDASCSTKYFRPTPGYSYQASGWFKVESAQEGAVIRPRVDLWDADAVYALDREFLEATVAQNIAFSEAYDVPVYCGEFGVNVNCFEEDRGGDRWMADVLDIFAQADISFNYHAYHDGSFGLYADGSLPDVSKRNETLYALFCEMIGS